MISNIQPIGDIKKAGRKEEKKRSSDPIQAEYDDGIEFLKENDLTRAAVAFHNVLRSYEEKSIRMVLLMPLINLGRCISRRVSLKKPKFIISVPGIYVIVLGIP